jgi:ribosomal protein L22
MADEQDPKADEVAGETQPEETTAAAKPARKKRTAKAAESEQSDAPKAKATKAAKAPRRARKAPAAEEQAPVADADSEVEAVAEESAPEAQAAPKPARKRPARKAAAEPAEEEKAPAPAPRRTREATKAARRRVVRAHARYVRTSARKARLVCGHLRGKSVDEARAILAFTPRDVARDWSKLLESAVANAESNHELLEEDLIVREAYADEGPTIKRFRPRAMGRATPIRKRTSHLTIALVARPEPPAKKNG